MQRNIVDRSFKPQTLLFMMLTEQGIFLTFGLHVSMVIPAPYPLMYDIGVFVFTHLTFMKNSKIKLIGHLKSWLNIKICLETSFNSSSHIWGIVSQKLMFSHSLIQPALSIHCPSVLFKFTYMFLLLLGSCLAHPHIFSLPKKNFTYP